MRAPRHLPSFLLFSLALAPGSARAGHPYVEFGAGMCSIRGADPLFDGSGPSPSRFGASVQGAFIWDVAPPSAPAKFYVGAQHRLLTGASDTRYFGLQAAYPMVRMETNRFFVGAGATNFVWTRARTESGLDYFHRSPSTLAGLLEAGYVWPITPQVAFQAHASGQVMRGESETLGPKPTVELTAVLRFRLFGGSSTFAEEKRRSSGFSGGPGQYEGYRYPYGFQKAD